MRALGVSQCRAQDRLYIGVILGLYWVYTVVIGLVCYCFDVLGFRVQE